MAFFCLCHLGNKTFSHTASSEKKWPKGNSPTGTFKDYLPPLRYLAGFSPTLFSQIELKWPVSISVLFFTLIWDFLNFFTISGYLQNAENALFSSLHLCKMRLRNRKVWPVSVSAVSCSFGASGLNSSCFQHSTAVKGGGPTKLWASWERSLRTSQTPSSQSHLSRRGKSKNVP